MLLDRGDGGELMAHLVSVDGKSLLSRHFIATGFAENNCFLNKGTREKLSPHTKFTVPNFNLTNRRSSLDLIDESYASEDKSPCKRQPGERTLGSLPVHLLGNSDAWVCSTYIPGHPCVTLFVEDDPSASRQATSKQHNTLCLVQGIRDVTEATHETAAPCWAEETTLGAAVVHGAWLSTPTTLEKPILGTRQQQVKGIKHEYRVAVVTY